MDGRDQYLGDIFNSSSTTSGFCLAPPLNRAVSRPTVFSGDGSNGGSSRPISYHPRIFHHDAVHGNGLESEFSRLNISRRSPSLNGGGGGGGGGGGFSSEVTNMQRLRALYAARAQNLFVDPDHYNLFNLNNLNHQFLANMSNLNHTNGLPSTFGNNLQSYETVAWNYRAPVGDPPRRQIFSSLNELRGRIAMAAMDQMGCRFLQSKFDEGNPEDIYLIFMEIKDSICDLMVDQFGNYLVQKFFRVCSEDQMTQLLCLLINDEGRFKAICTDMHGTRAVQKLIEHLTTPEQRSLITSVLRRLTLPLIKNNNGQHVIQHCLRYFKEDNKHILNVIANNCLEVATDRSGCCVLQQCLILAIGESRDRLIAEITSNALFLSEHPYGNYVVQYILGFKIPHVTSLIIANLSGNFVSLSKNKYASNVVEQCLKQLGDPIIEELMRSPNFLSVLQDEFGNFVAQTALTASKGATQHALMELIRDNSLFLHNHLYGQRVLNRYKGMKLRP